MGSAQKRPRVIAFANQKGGVAKTTTTLNLAVAFVEKGFRVLCVDMDPQGNLTMSQGIDPDSLETSMYDVLVHHISIREVIRKREVDVACASIDLAGAEIAMSTQIGRERSLEKALRAIADDYDFVCIDTPPSLGLLTINALTAADKVIVPVQCEYLSMRGLIQLQNTLQMIRENLNPDVDIEGILPTLMDTRTVHAKEAIEILEENFGDRVFASRIKKTIRFAEAPGQGDVGPEVRSGRDGRPVLSRSREGGSRQWQAVSARACGKARWPPCSAARTRTRPRRPTAERRPSATRPQPPAAPPARARPPRRPHTAAGQQERRAPQPPAERASAASRSARRRRARLAREEPQDREPPAHPRETGYPHPSLGATPAPVEVEEPRLPTPQERLRHAFSTDIPDDILEPPGGRALRRPRGATLPRRLRRADPVGPGQARSASPCCASSASAAPASTPSTAWSRPRSRASSSSRSTPTCSRCSSRRRTSPCTSARRSPAAWAPARTPTSAARRRWTSTTASSPCSRART